MPNCPECGSTNATTDLEDYQGTTAFACESWEHGGLFTQSKSCRTIARLRAENEKLRGGLERLTDMPEHVLLGQGKRYLDGIRRAADVAAESLAAARLVSSTPSREQLKQMAADSKAHPPSDAPPEDEDGTW